MLSIQRSTILCLVTTTVSCSAMTCPKHGMRTRCLSGSIQRRIAQWISKAQKHLCAHYGCRTMAESRHHMWSSKGRRCPNKSSLMELSTHFGLGQNCVCKPTGSPAGMECSSCPQQFSRPSCIQHQGSIWLNSNAFSHHSWRNDKHTAATWMFLPIGDLKQNSGIPNRSARQRTFMGGHLLDD